MERVLFRLIYHSFTKVQLGDRSYRWHPRKRPYPPCLFGWDNGFAPSKGQSIAWTNDDLVQGYKCFNTLKITLLQNALSCNNSCFVFLIPRVFVLGSNWQEFRNGFGALYTVCHFFIPMESVHPHDHVLLFVRGHQSSASQSLCEGKPPFFVGFLSQRTSNTENVSIWWRHHALSYLHNHYANCFLCL